MERTYNGEFYYIIISDALYGLNVKKKTKQASTNIKLFQPNYTPYIVNII